MSFRRRFPRANPQPQTNFDDYLTVPIGKGSYGTVFKGIHKKTFAKYAIKQIRKKGHQRFIHYQLQIMYSIDCENIVKLIDHFETEFTVCLILEFVEGKQLFDGIINRKIKLNYKQVAKIIYELCLALQYIHSKGIIHRDIKPQNIMLDKDGKVKLADFGAANYVAQNETRKTFIGTPQYMAPELLYQNQQSRAVDVWAVGVILYELTTMKLPFTAKTTPKIYQNIKNIKYEFPVCIQRQTQLKNLISRIFTSDPTKRPSVIQIKNHPWIQKHLQDKKQSLTKNIYYQPLQEQKQIQSDWKQNKQKLLSKIRQLQSLVKHQQGTKDYQYEKHKLQIQRKISLLQNKIDVSKNMKQRKQKIVQQNNSHLEQLKVEVHTQFEFREQLEAVRDQIQSGNTRYLSALEQRKKLKMNELKLEQQINKLKMLIRKNSNKQANGGKVTTSTLTSNRIKSEDCQIVNRSPTLKKSLSFSIIQIEQFLAEIREKKRRLNGVQSSTNLHV